MINKPLYIQLIQTARMVERELAQAGRSYGLSTINLYVLQALYQKSPQQPSQLAFAVGYPNTAFTPLLDQLERGGWITRGRHKNDARCVLIALTPAAESKRENILKTLAAIDAALSRNLQPEVFAVMLRQLRGADLLELLPRSRN